jgi:hypothetical protein
MNKDEFMKNVAEAVVIKQEGKRSIILITILLAVLGAAASFITTKCLNNNFARKLFIRRAIRKGCYDSEVARLAAKEELSCDDIYEEYGDALVNEIILQKDSLQPHEIKEMLSGIPVD